MKKNNKSGLAAATLLSAALLYSGAAAAQTALGAGFGGQHDGQRGQVYLLDWVPDGTPLDFTAGALRGTQARDTSFVAASYEIVDEHLWASFGPAMIRHQTSTLTSQYQFMTTFGLHWKRASMGVRHLSNGGLKGKNIGENMVFFAFDF